MKAFYVLLLPIICFLSCRQERMVAKGPDQPIFNIEHAGSKIAPFGPYVSDAAVSVAVYRELRQQEVPFPEPAKTMLAWQDYYKVLNSRKSLLSGPAREMAYSLLLNDYGLHQAPFTGELKNALEASLSVLAENRHKGYKLLYTYLMLLKRNNEGTFVVKMQQQILNYAVPATIPAGNNSPLFEQPGAESQFGNALAAARDNETYLERIRLLK